MIGPEERRAVVLVGGPAAPYSRALRIARALAAEGWAVEIAAVAAAGLPEREVIAPPAPGSAGAPEPEKGSAGPIELRRYRPSGPWAVLGATDATAGIGEAGPTGRTRSGARGVALTVARPLLALRRWLFWPHTVRGWWSTLERDLAPADLYHACGSLAIGAALEARDRSAGRRGRVIYDAIDDVAESNTTAAMPRFVRRWIARREAGWARAADAVVTVNDALGRRLAARWRLDRSPLVVTNMPEPSAIPARTADRSEALRAAGGLPPWMRIVLFQGRLGPDLGLDAAADAVLHVPDAALVLIGFGRGMVASLARDRDPRFAGRHVTLPARHPDELLAWTAGADVAIIPLPPASANQRLSTPNKFWEALAVGTPVVVVAGLEVMEQLVRDRDLGAVAASPSPEDLAAAIETVLARNTTEGPAWRERIAASAAEHHGWPGQATAYRALVRSVFDGDGDGAGDRDAADG